MQAALYLVVAAAIGGLVATSLRRLYPDEITGRTDVVGYPIFGNFNIRIYFVKYFLLVVVFPVVTILGFVVLDRAGRRWIPGAARIRPRLFPATTPDDGPDPDTGVAVWLVAVARAGLVGCTLAAGLAVAADAGRQWVWSIVVPVTGAYVAMIAGAAWVGARRWAVPRREAMAALNALGGPLVLVTLLMASESTEVVVVDSGQVDQYRWLPVPLVIGGVLAALLWTLARLRRGDRRQWPSIERWSLLLFTGPVAVWLLTSRLPSGSVFAPEDLRPPDYFHDGEWLTPVSLMSDGAFPWRDLVFIHGFLNDIGFRLVAVEVFGDTHWASPALAVSIVRPLFGVGMYLLFVFLFWRNWAVLLGSQLLLVLGVIPAPHERLILLPYLLLAVAALLKRATWPRASAVSLLALAIAILVPEASFFSVVAGVVVVVYEAVHRAPGAPLAEAFGRTLRCVVVGLVGLAGWVGFLAYHGAFGAFLDYYRTFVGDHEMAGGMPIVYGDAYYNLWIYAPVVCILVGWCFAAWRVRSRTWFTVQDWVVGIALVGLVPYYTKFLSRPDQHIFQTASVALVPMAYIVYRLVQALDRGWLARGRAQVRLVSGSAFVLVAGLALVRAPLGAGETLRSVPGRWRSEVPTESAVERIGYSKSETVAPEALADLELVLDAYLGDDGRLFDFTNNPAMFGFLIDRPLATRYYHVSMAIPASSQRQLIAELERDRPEVVVYESRYYGLPMWDGIINAVRHYLVSDYLLERYEPIAEISGYVLMRRADIPEVPMARLSPRLNTPPAVDDLRAVRPCDWGYAPEYLSETSSSDEGLDLAVRPGGGALTAIGWAIEERTGKPAAEILVVLDQQVVGRIPIGAQRTDVASSLGTPDGLDSGFDAQPLVLTTPDIRRSDQLRLFALTANGEAAELDTGTETEQTPLERLLVAGDDPIPVVPTAGAVQGNVEYVGFGADSYLVDLPSDAQEYDWIEVETTSPWGDDRIAVNDLFGVGARRISRQTLPGESRTAQFMVGNCPQWFGYEDTIQINTASGAEITGVRLIE